MTTENKYCANCGVKLQEGTSFCGNCGKIITENEEIISSYEVNKQKKTGKGKSIGTIISVVLILIVSFVAKFAVNYMVDDFSSNNQIEKIDSYIERMKDYTPGYSTDEKYVSTHFGFQFTTDENWIMYSEEELEPVSESGEEAFISGCIADMKSRGESQEMIDKWVSSVYTETEMGAYYVIDDTVIGEVTVDVLSAYGLDEISADAFAAEIKPAFETTMSDTVVSSKKIIAGESYNSLKATLNIDDIAMTTEVFVRIENGIICIITCRALEGYDDAVIESFLGQVSSYN